jgi:DNA polymerase IV
MSSAQALCPPAVVLPSDMGRYARVRMIGLSPLVEPLSIHEAFLDLTGCKGSNGASAAETLVRFARQVEVKVGVAVSVGVSYANFWRNLPRILISRAGSPS